MNEINIITIKWNCYNGFIFEFINFDMFKPINIDSSLLGINVSKWFLYIDIFWIHIKIFHRSYTE